MYEVGAYESLLVDSCFCRYELVICNFGLAKFVLVVCLLFLSYNTELVVCVLTNGIVNEALVYDASTNELPLTDITVEVVCNLTLVDLFTMLVECVNCVLVNTTLVV